MVYKLIALANKIDQMGLKHIAKQIDNVINLIVEADDNVKSNPTQGPIAVHDETSDAQVNNGSKLLNNNVQKNVAVNGRTVDWYDVTSATQNQQGTTTIQDIKATAPGKPDQVIYHQVWTTGPNGSKTSNIVVPWSMGTKTAPENNAA